MTYVGNTEYVYLKGKVKRCQVNVPDQWGNWTVGLYLTPESLDKFKEMKVKNHLHKDDEGYYIWCKRPQSKLIKGKMVGMHPPIVKNAEGIELHDVLIGNGSDVTVKMEHYNYTFGAEKGSACRLHTIRVDNLIPYEARIEDMEAYDNEHIEQKVGQDLF
jgi:hypothetical protein